MVEGYSNVFRVVIVIAVLDEFSYVGMRVFCVLSSFAVFMVERVVVGVLVVWV